MARPNDEEPFVTTKKEWLEKTYQRGKERTVRFSTVSDLEVDPLYTPDDVAGDYATTIGYPGEYPCTRGVYDSMYRGRLWFHEAVCRI